MKRKRSLQGVFLMEKCEMKGLIKTDSVIVILYFVKIYAGKEQAAPIDKAAAQSNSTYLFFMKNLP